MKSFTRAFLPALLLASAASAAEPAAAPQTPPRRPVVQVMTLTSTSWKDGGLIPDKYAQPGHDTSPAFAWDNVPEGTDSFVLIARDLDAITPTGGVSYFHWMLWNIPKTVRSIPEGQGWDSQWPDGTRQISSAGPYYKGPAAPEAGPLHHYTFELYALSGAINVAASGPDPLTTEATVVEALSGKILGKGVYTGLYKRGQTPAKK